MSDTIENTALTDVYDDSVDLSNAFDEYCYDNGIKMSNYWEGMAEHWNIDEFADVMDDNDITTIQGCIDFFC